MEKELEASAEDHKKQREELRDELAMMQGILTSTYGKDTHFVIKSYRAAQRSNKKAPKEK